MNSEIRFGNLAQLRKESVKPDSVTELPYLGLEHIQPGSLQISAMGVSSDVTSQKLRFYKGDILFGKLRPYFRKIATAPVDGICSTDIWVVRGVDPADNEFIKYWMASEEFIRSSTHAAEGSGMPRAQWNWVSEFRIPGLSREARQAIGRILGLIDEKIVANLELTQTLEQVAQSVFKSWFVDFDPVHAKARGEQPEGIDAETAALFPESFEESAMGAIPSGWEVREARDLFDFSIGRTPPRKENEWFCDGGEGIPWVSIRDMGSYGAFTGATAEGLTDEAIGKFRVPVVPPGSVLVSFKLTLGRVAIARRPLATNEAIAHFIPRDTDSIPTEFAYLWLKNLDYTSLDSTSSIATATNSSLMKQILFLKPSDEVMRVFIERCAMLFLEIENLTLQNERLSEIRDSLLPRLISGELEVPDELMGG